MTEQTTTDKALAVADKAVDKLPESGKLIDKLTEVVDVISAKVVAVAPKAWDIICNIKMIESIQSLVYATIMLGVGVGLVNYSIKRMRKLSAYDDGFFECILFVIGAGAFILSLLELFTVWNWIGVFQPDLAIAYDVYKGVVGK